VVTLLLAVGQLPAWRMTEFLTRQATSESEPCEEDGKTKTAAEEVTIPRGRQRSVARKHLMVLLRCCHVASGVSHITPSVKALFSRSPHSDLAQRNGFGAPLRC
jgi:hypothetical protein